MALVRRVAPDFATLIERDGLKGALRRLISDALRSLFGGFMRRLQSVGIFRDALSAFSSAAAAFSAIAGQLARGDCCGLRRRHGG